MGSAEVMGVDTESLLASSGWVRALARSLVVDAHRAEDLSQDAWIAALEGRPSNGVLLRRWIAAVMRNLARQSRRGELRRADRELAAARAAGQAHAEPVADSLERLEAHRAVVEAVMGLHEPYRTAVVLRYFDGLEPRAIAERDRIPVRTVHTRLTRAHALLRARLERSLGRGAGRESAGAWLPMIGLLLGPERPAGVLGTTLGAVLMDAKLKVAAGAVAIAGLVVVSRPLWTASSPGTASAGAPAAPTELVAPEALPPSAAPVEVESARSTVVAESAPVTQDSAVARSTIRARAIDVEGLPVAGLPVCHSTAQGQRGPIVRTDPQGFADVPIAAPPRQLEIADERWVTVLEPVFWDSDIQAVNILVVAARLTLGGMVVDEAGTPLSAARLAVHLSWDFRSRLPLVLDSSRARSWETVSDSGGAFLLETAALPREFLSTRLAGYETHVLHLPPASSYDLRIVLAAPRDLTGLVRGIVVDEQGFAVEGARVALGYEHTRSGPDGGFELQAREHDERGVLTALAPGRLPARLERRGNSSRAPEAWPDPLVLRLGGPPLTIRGRVLDADQEPVAGASVSVVDGTNFGPVESGASDQFTTAGLVEALLSGGVSQLEVRTTSDGAFELEGLLPRAYHLAVSVEEGFLYSEHGPIEAGRRDVVLRLATERLIPHLSGNVLSLSGQPVPGANVVLMRPRPPASYSIDFPRYEWLVGRSVTTDERGRFTFQGVSAAVTHLAIHGPELGLGRQIELPSGADLEQLELRVPLRCHVQVDLTGSSVQADDFSLLDGAGTALPLGSFYGDFAFSGERLQLIDGRSEVVSAAEDARTLVLYRHGAEEVLRMPVALAVGELNVLRP